MTRPVGGREGVHRDGHRAAHGEGAPVSPLPVSPGDGHVAPQGPPTTRCHERGRKPAVMTARRPRVVGGDGPPGRSRWSVTPVGDRSAALLVRVWLEDGAPVFRGRLTTMETSPDGRGAEEVAVALTSSPHDVVDAVRAWLTQFLDNAAGSVDGDDSQAEPR